MKKVKVKVVRFLPIETIGWSLTEVHDLREYPDPDYFGVVVEDWSHDDGRKIVVVRRLWGDQPLFGG